LQTIFEFLLSVQHPISLHADALDGIIDIYSDETSSHDSVFRNGPVLETLQERVAVVKAEAKKIDKRKEPELRVKLDGVAVNLAAFVDYRRSLRL
jgi:hypothetical protein